jgi:hypothetical protein
MGILFHDGSNRVFQRYTQGRAWDDPRLLGHVHQSWSAFNTVEVLEPAIRGMNPCDVPEAFGSFASLLASRDFHLWVVKGLHQAQPIRVDGRRIFQTHATAGFEGVLYHLYFFQWNHRLHYNGFTAGEQYGETAEGFQVVGVRPGRRGGGGRRR